MAMAVAADVTCLTFQIIGAVRFQLYAKQHMSQIMKKTQKKNNENNKNKNKVLGQLFSSRGQSSSKTKRKIM